MGMTSCQVRQMQADSLCISMTSFTGTMLPMALSSGSKLQKSESQYPSKQSSPCAPQWQQARTARWTVWTNMKRNIIVCLLITLKIKKNGRRREFPGNLSICSSINWTMILQFANPNFWVIYCSNNIHILESLMYMNFWLSRVI